MLLGGYVAYIESPAPSLAVDYSKLPTIIIDAKNVPLGQILDQLAE